MAKKSILIVDDEENIVLSLSDFLESDYDCHRAYSVDEAIDLLSKNHIDLVISDVRMPGKTGFELIRWMKDNKPKVKTIMMTAYGSDSVKRALRKEGAIFYFEKPIDYSELKGIIKHIFSPKGFSADLNGMDLVDILQILAFSGKDCIISVHNKLGESGRLFLKNGVLLNAETELHSGVDAFYDVIKWESGAFIVAPFEGETTPKISFSLEHLLLEVSRIHDEREKEFVSAKEKAELGDLKNFLKEAKDNLEECVAVYVFDSKNRDILTKIVDDNKYDISQAIKTGELTESKKLPLDEFMLTMGNTYILMQQVSSDGVMFIAVFKKPCSMGLNHLTVSKYKPLFANLLKSPK